MARINITFDGASLQSSTISIRELSHENIGSKMLNVQKFADRGGGKLGHIGFDVKKIKVSGTIKATTRALLDSAIDDLKRLLNKREKNLDIEYTSGIRRYIATCSSLSFERNYYTIDAIDWEGEFTINDPAFGTDLDTTTLEFLGLSGSSGGGTLTLESSNIADYTGTIRPYPKVKITINSCLGISRINFENKDEDGFFSRTRLESIKFQDGDIIIIDTENGSVKHNGIDVEFYDGFPKFSLTHNSWTLKIIGESYNVDVKLIYYSLWL